MIQKLLNSPRKVARNIFTALKRAKANLLNRGTILLLGKKLQPAHLTTTLLVKEYTTELSDILDIYKSVSRYNCYLGSDDDTRMASRLAHKMKFYAAFDGSRVIAYCWLHSESYRFFDEIACHVGHGKNDLWLRDVYVVPEMRGKKLFSKFIEEVIYSYYPDANNLYSDVFQNNSPSLRAHLNLGLEIIGRVQYVMLFKRFLLRKIESGKLDVTGYRFPKKLIVIDNDFYKYNEKNRC